MTNISQYPDPSTFIKFSEAQIQEIFGGDSKEGKAIVDYGAAFALSYINLTLSKNCSEGARSLLSKVENNQNISKLMVDAMDAVKKWQADTNSKTEAEAKKALEKLNAADPSYKFELGDVKKADVIITSIGSYQSELGSQNNVLMVQIQDLTTKSTNFNNNATNIVNKMTEQLSVIARAQQ